MGSDLNGGGRSGGRREWGGVSRHFLDSFGFMYSCLFTFLGEISFKEDFHKLNFLNHDTHHVELTTF